MQEVSIDAALARSPAALLRDRTFGPYFAGKVMSSCGAWIQTLAAAVLMYQLTGSAFMVGAVSFAQFIGPLLFAFWAGSLADRFDRRRVVMLGRCALGLTVGSLALTIGIRGADSFGGATALLPTMLVVGVLYAITSPAQHALVPALVPPEDLEPALALSSAAPSIARTLGPAFGAGLLLVGGPALAFAVTAGGHLMLALILSRIRPRSVELSSTPPSVFGGLRYVKEDRKAAMLLLGVAALAIGSDPIITLTPSMADMYGGGEQIVGLLAAAFGFGAVLSTLSIRRLRLRISLRMLGMAGFWLLTLGLTIASLSSGVGVATGGLVVAGSGFMIASVALNIRIQRRIPEDLRGRVMALWAVAWLGSRPIAAVLNGSVADGTSVRTALLLAAVLTAASSLLARTSYGNGEPAPRLDDVPS